MDYIESSLYKNKFDIYLLDVVMPAIKGTEVASFIRKIDDDCHIIFITSSPEYAVDSYDVFASGYIVKPILRKKFFATLDRTISKITSDTNYSQRISVKTKDGIKSIMINKIRFAEYKNHVIEFHTVNENTICSVTGSMTISGLMKLLENNSSFVMPHRAFIVNLEYVSSLEGSNFIMNKAEKIPVSRTAMKNIKQKFTPKKN
jgi:DNA-binding LytR/AlgR family response regulator